MQRESKKEKKSLRNMLNLLFGTVGFALFTRNHGFLADRYVNVGQKKRSRDEVIQLLKDRLAPLRGSTAKKTTKTA